LHIQTKKLIFTRTNQNQVAPTTPSKLSAAFFQRIIVQAKNKSIFFTLKKETAICYLKNVDIKENIPEYLELNSLIIGLSILLN
jgi:type III secretion system FlhB-like substrate exporter